MLFQVPEAEAASAESEAAAAKTDPSLTEKLQDPEQWIPLVQQYALPLIYALAIFLIGRMVAKMITGGLRKALQARQLEDTLIAFLTNLTYMLLLTLVVITALGQVGIETAQFAAILAAGAFAVGFALQGSLSNFASGVMLIIFRPFKAGDFIEGGGVAGIVEEIGVFCTILRTGDNKKVIVPNSAMGGGNITNYSANETRRVDMVFGIGYGDDIALAKKTIDEVLKADERILADPAPTVGLTELADSSVNFVVRPWVKTADYWNVYFAIHENMKLAFDAKGISIPFPQQDVHMHQVEGAA